MPEIDKSRKTLFIYPNFPIPFPSLARQELHPFSHPSSPSKVRKSSLYLWLKTCIIFPNFSIPFLLWQNGNYIHILTHPLCRWQENRGYTSDYTITPRSDSINGDDDKPLKSRFWCFASKHTSKSSPINIWFGP